MRAVDADELKEKLQARRNNSEEDFDRGFDTGIGVAMNLIHNAPTVELNQELTKNNQGSNKGDLISRDKLKKAIDTIKQTGYDNNYEPLFEYVELPDLIKVINASTVKFSLMPADETKEDAYKKGYERGKIEGLLKRPQGEWIPVSEGLPERYTDVIVTDIETSNTYQSRYVGNGYWECDNGTLKNRIIAWMPLPEPYKKGSEEE